MKTNRTNKPANDNRWVRAIAMILMIVAVALTSACKKTTSEETTPITVTPDLRFVFMADSRGDSMGYMVDTTALNPIIRQIGTLNPKPSFIVFGGDGCYRGYMKGAYTFQEFKDLFKNLTDNGIPLYTAVGNHELYHEHSRYGFLRTNQEEFQNVFSENPSNGPAGYEHLTYSFTHAPSNAFFAVLDAYYVDKDTVHPKDLGGHIDSAQMEWLKKHVAQSNALHKFLFIHTPYYYVTNDPDEASSADTSYTKLWSFLDANKFDFYACGHSHLYAQRTITSDVAPLPQTNPVTPNWQNNVLHLLCGTCGAGPDDEYVDPTVRTAWDVHNDHATYYFTVIDIVKNKVTINSYKGFTGTYTIFETLTITK
jgi:hypothetical protein